MLMSTPLLSPVFRAQPEALAEALESLPLDKDGPDRDRVVALLKAILPEVEQTPIRMKRLNNALVEWVLKGPRPWREIEDSRQEFLEIFESQSANVARILAAAAPLGFSSEELAGLNRAVEELHRLREQIFSTWQAFTPDDWQAAREEIRQGKVHDLDEVIRELQGRAN
jgi:hypothetical protein